MRIHRFSRSMRVALVAGLRVLAFAHPASAVAGKITVGSAKDIRLAMAAAKPGDVISIPPGEYTMGEALVAGNSGTRDKPITLRTRGETGYAKLKITGESDVGFRILGKFWVLHGLHIEGNPDATLDLIQIDATRGGSALQMMDCRVSCCKEYLFKASRSREQDSDDVILDHCEWFDCPGTAIDLVAGDHWISRARRTTSVRSTPARRNRPAGWIGDCRIGRPNPFGSTPE